MVITVQEAAWRRSRATTAIVARLTELRAAAADTEDGRHQLAADIRGLIPALDPAIDPAWLEKCATDVEASAAAWRAVGF